jgi:very-short-patch-repair endonuclease
MGNRGYFEPGVSRPEGLALPLFRHRVRELRHNQTEAEKRLWKALRASRLDGLRFRRQFPIAQFIADFCCKEKMLIVELDGDQHAEQVAYDLWRTGILERRGYRVIRFWNQEVTTNLDGVVEAILVAARSTTP